MKGTVLYGPRDVRFEELDTPKITKSSATDQLCALTTRSPRRVDLEKTVYHALWQVEKSLRMAKSPTGPADLPPPHGSDRGPPDHRVHRARRRQTLASRGHLELHNVRGHKPFGINHL